MAAPLLLVSIDGLRPGDVLEADRRGLRIPNLRRFVAEGAYASGVTGVLPTLTYPSHTTLLTGVSPARHGIANNTTFDPAGINQTGWYWYAADDRAETLWTAAHRAGLSTANVHWPVSVGAADVDNNLPQIWRTGHDDDRKLLRVLATPGLIDGLERDLGPYAQGIDESVDGDASRTRFAARLIATRKPGFVTVYLAGLDHIEHVAGPGSAEANAALERIDAMIGSLAEAERTAHPDAVIAVVSDHGFASVDTDINLIRPFVAAGLIRLDAAGKVSEWEAEPWFAGGSAAIVLARPDDAALVAKVRTLLERLKADPAMRIAEIIDRPEIARRGGATAASFFVYFQLGAEMGRDPAAAPVSPSKSKGMHGFSAALPEMRSTFLIAGPGIGLHGDLGEIDMRRIAPTLARVMGTSLPGAEMQPLGR
jgi:predicted AlkP superfamily pyrophosphatase or phosphodiesterase